MYTYVQNTGKTKVTIFTDERKDNKIAELKPKEGIVFMAAKAQDLFLISEGKGQVAQSTSNNNCWINCRVIKLN